MLRIAAQQPMLFVMEDLHWVDPTTLEFLTLLVDQGPTARILALWTFRPDFSPPWTGRSHLTQVTLPRLPRQQATEMTDRVAHGKALPAEVVEQVVAKTDGVPLFVEELTKMVLESGLLQEREDRYELTGPLPPLAIPTTLHDSLMARLDRLATVKSLAQLGATLGREFSYALLHAVSPWDEETLQRGLHQLVEAELLYQRGLPPQATYLFKHALIQDAAYQSLLQSTRQQYHQRIAQVLEARFPEARARRSRSCWPSTTRQAGCHDAGHALLAAGGRTSQRALGQSGSHQPLHDRASQLLTDLARDPGAYPAGPWPCISPSAQHCRWRPRAGSARKSEHAYTQARDVVSTGRRDTTSSVPVLLGLWRFYLTTVTVADGTRARGARSCAWRNMPTTPALAVIAHLCPWGDVVLAGRIRLLPASTWRRVAPATPASPAPCAVVPHGARPGCGLPSHCCADPLVAGVSGSSPGAASTRP